MQKVIAPTPKGKRYPAVAYTQGPSRSTLAEVHKIKRMRVVARD